ncbi:MAG: hypothetical protein ACE5IT_04365 [bacterium]
MGVCVFFSFKLSISLLSFNSVMQQTLRLVVSGIIGMIIFIGISLLMGLEEINKVWGLVNARFKQTKKWKNDDY